MSPPCANSGCDNAGSNLCGGCKSVKYCSSVCQKAHWKAHKADCKKFSEGSSSSVVPAASVAPLSPYTPPLSSGLPLNTHIDPKLIQHLVAAKNETQQAFQSGNFNMAVIKGLKAIEFASKLPPLERAVECIQLHLNMTTAHIQLGKIPEAERHVNLCVDVAEENYKVGISEQSTDLLSLSLNSKAQLLANTGRLSEAEKVCLRSQKLLETILKGSDSRICKCLRSLAMIYDRQNNLVAADEVISRAYRLLLEDKGPLSQDTQTCLDEVVAVETKLEQFDRALKHTQLHYNRLLKEKIDPEHVLIGDACSRLASILVRMDRAVEAEETMRRSLDIREKRLGKDHPAVAITLTGLAQIREIRHNFGEETEALLLRALDIHKKQPGSGAAQHISQVLALIQQLRSNREIVEEEAKMMAGESLARPPSAAKKPVTGTPALPSNKEGMIMLDPNDGISRLRAAGVLFERKEFGLAEVVLTQAHTIFLRDHGPEHQNTRAAQQNLEIVRNNHLNMLWHEVVMENLNDKSRWASEIVAGDADVAEKIDFNFDDAQASSCSIS